MPKRKRLPEEKNDEDSLNSTLNEGRPKRRRNDTTLVDTIQYIFDALRNKKKDDDVYLCEAFLRVPRKKTEPQYYEVVKKPIDMLKIQQKIKTDIYNEIEEFCVDIQLLVENAKLYYAKSTDEYKDACELWEIFEIAKKEAPEEIKEKQRQNQEDEDVKTKRRPGRPAKASLALSAPMMMEEDGTPMTVDDAIEELFGAIVTASDTERRIYSYDFYLLPAPERYPDYYQVIQQPIDLKTIAFHIQSKQYENLESLERDMVLMLDNACAFNEPGSRIFKDARILKNLVKIRKQDLLHVLNAKKSVRLRSKRAPDGKKWSELVANLNEGEVLPLPEVEQIDLSVSMTTHEDDDSDDEIDQDNPCWQLFTQTKSLTAPNDPNYLLVEPFRRLPNRRWHADYYVEIKNAISLSQIKKKAIKGEYRSISDMADDFDLMFDNAQQYNRRDSRIFRDAVKLQKFVHTKVEELSHLEEEQNQDSESDMDDENDSQMGMKQKASKPWTFKRRAKLLFKTLMDFMTDDGRQPIVAFIEKPSRKDYADYYEVINDPIDMEMIESKIKSDHYNNDEDLITDFRRMFQNCQTYNEEGSQIYKDANILSKVLNDKLREIQGSGDVQSGHPKVAKKNKYSQFLATTKNIKFLYNAIKDYRDKDNRQISEVFNRIPAKSLYPDYYEVIKQPIDLETILQKWKDSSYSTLNDILNDLTLMFQNACRYNEPESQIYRDALTLQRLALQKRLELTSREENVPDVGALVQELLMSLFISVFNLEEPDGRYAAESFSELPDYEETDGKKSRGISFDIMKRRLDKGFYHRLDQFQNDLFAVFDRARKFGRRSSRLFLDSVTLQKEYMKVRDELCSHGSILTSQALDFKDKDFNELLSKFDENHKGTSSSKDEDENESMMEDEDSKASTQSSEGAATNSASVSHNEVQYHVGDFVKVNSTDGGPEFRIVHIQRLWVNQEGEQMLYGCHYFKPSETFHLPTRKFYEQEVFKTEIHLGVPLSSIVGKCVVLSSLDYPKYIVEDFETSDVYVCECRYSSKHRLFKKIKVWPFQLPEEVKMTERPQPIEMNKVGSVFRDRVDKHKEELAEVEEETKIQWNSVPNVIQQCDPGDKSRTFYQQYNISSGPLKIGDFVYTRNGGTKTIRHISRIWVTADGNGFFSGSRYIMVPDGNLPPNRNPYKNEVYLTNVQEQLPLSDILGRCCILFIKEYVAMRHTEIDEKDVYICENFFDELTQRVCCLQSGIVKFNLSSEVKKDEIYHFWRPINISKMEVAQPSLLQKKLKQELLGNNVDMENEDSMDGPPPSIASADSSAPSTPRPVKKVKKNSTGKKVLSGYIMFSGDIRKTVMNNNPESNFGEVSRLVGNEWKRLTESERKAFEDRAHQVNLESAERAAQQNLLDGNSPLVLQNKINIDLPLPKNADVVFECMWETCDFVFEDVADLYDHLLAEPNGHVFKVKSVFECSWRGCPRQKKNSLAPFVMIQRLARHIREVHIMKNNGIYMQHAERSRNFITSSRKSLFPDNSQSAPTSQQTPTQQQATGLSAGRENQYQITFGAPIQVNGHSNAAMNGITSVKMDPLFVNPPPKTQRLLHSEAYIKYIENLDKSFVSNWERQLSATVENSIMNESGRLPSQWLSNGAGNHGSVVNALWALREYMMKDSLGIAKVL